MVAGRVTAAFGVTVEGKVDGDARSYNPDTPTDATLLDAMSHRRNTFVAVVHVLGWRGRVTVGRVAVRRATT